MVSTVVLDDSLNDCGAAGLSPKMNEQMFTDQTPASVTAGHLYLKSYLSGDAAL